MQHRWPCNFAISTTWMEMRSVYQIPAFPTTSPMLPTRTHPEKQSVAAVTPCCRRHVSIAPRCMQPFGELYVVMYSKIYNACLSVRS